MTQRDKQIQKWAIIAFAIVEAVIIAAVLFVRG
jgi:archaellum biogenesis protein FlaJ (TadC family)